MRKWGRPISGTVFTVLLFIHGLPGFIADSLSWYSWVESISLPFFIYPIGMVGGVLFGTSEWWWPRFAAACARFWDLAGRLLQFGKAGESDRGDSLASVQSFEGMTRFKACLPHVQRCRKLIRPYAGTGGLFTIAKQVRDARDVFAEIATELEFIATQLGELGIASPEIWGEEGNQSLKDVHHRLLAWSSHLARLEAKIHQEDLAGASY